MKFINKLKDKNNLPVLLLLIIVLNFLPLFIGNAFTKDVNTVSAFVEVICFFGEIILLANVFFYNKNDLKINKNKIIALVVITVIMFFTQVKNFIQSKFFFMDILNIGCIFVNIILFYIALYDFKIQEKNIAKFFKGICIIGILATIWNLVLYAKEIFAEIGIINIDWDYSHIDNIKSFFANRNVLAFFLYLAIISSAILMNLENKSKKYWIFISVFIFGIWCTHSKTGFIQSIVFLELFIFFNKKYDLKKRLLICFGIGVLSILLFLNILGRLPENPKWQQIEGLVISDAQIKRLSGRKRIWQAGFNFLNQSPLNYIFGSGRFNSLEIIKFEDKTYAHFHNLYLDITLTGGLILLGYIFYMIYSIIRKIIKSDLKSIFKKIYIFMYITYGLYVLLESLGRFSVGCEDALCMIFLIAIPLLHSNSVKQKNIDLPKDECDKKIREKI